MMPVSEQQLSALLNGPSVRPVPRSEFIAAVESSVEKRRRNLQRSYRVTILAAISLLAGLVGLNLPDQSVVESQDNASVASSQTGDEITNVAATITDLQNGRTGLGGFARIVVSDAWLELGIAAVVAVLAIGLVRVLAARRRRRVGWWEPFTWLAIGSVCLIVGLTAAFDVFLLPSDSMAPTFTAGSRVIVDPDRTDPSLGDTVVTTNTDERFNVDSIIRRVVGLEGDTVDFEEGRILVNGELLDGLANGVVLPVGESVIVGDGMVLLISESVVAPNGFNLQGADTVLGTVRFKTALGS